MKLSSALYELGFKGLNIYNSNYSYKDGYPPQVEIVYTAEDQHLAFIRNMYISKLLSKENIWESVNIIGGLENNEITFYKIHNILEVGGAFLDDLSRFNPEFILENLFANDEFKQQDIHDFLLYWTQTAFNRAQKQERAWIPPLEWMKDPNLVKAYVDNSKVLGLIHAKPPIYTDFDETWVMGSAALPLAWKMGELKRNNELGLNPGFERYLGGERELSDMGELESKDIIKKIAEFAHVNFNTETPFIEGSKTLNYDQEETRKVYETDAIKYIYFNTFKQPLREENIINAKATYGKTRPDTKDTINLALDKLIERIREGQFHEGEEIKILISSIQPYIERQRIAADVLIKQRLTSEELADKYKISTFSLAQELHETIACSRVAILHSDMAALISEQYLRVTQGQEAKRDVNHLMFQSRQEYLKTLEFPPLPSKLIEEAPYEEVPLDHIVRASQPEEALTKESHHLGM